MTTTIERPRVWVKHTFADGTASVPEDVYRAMIGEERGAGFRTRKAAEDFAATAQDVIAHVWAEHVEPLTRQRDELAAALRELLAVAEYDWRPDWQAAYDAARAALASLR